MKKVIVTSCSHSQGRPSMRVTMSQITVTVNPVMATPLSTISARSRPSSARHFRWRWDCRTSERMTASPALLDVADQPQDLHRVRSQFLGELVLDRLAHLLESRLVDAGDDLDADFLQPSAR